MSFAPPVDVLGSLEIHADGPSLAAAVRSHDLFEARMCAALAAFDSAALWEIAGFTSAHAWLKEQGMHPRDAFELVKIARKLSQLRGTLAAWVAGTLTGGQVRIITGLIVDRHLERFASHEDELLPFLSSLSVDETLTAIRLWRDRADAEDAGDPPPDEPCTAHLSQTMDDRGVLNATLDAEGYSLWYEALRLADSDDLDTPAPLRRGEALVAIARFFVKNQDSKTPRRHTPHLKIMIDANTIGTDHLHGFDETTGMTLPPAALERIMCDCVMHRVVLAEGVVLDYGRAVKTPPPELAQAVAARDQGCRWKGCDRPVGWCDIHHVRQWSRDFGPTAIWNLILLCDKHHNMLHRRGWSARLHVTGDFEVTTACGETWVTHPPGRLRGQLPLPPPASTDDDDPPFERHHRDFEEAYLFRTRVDALIADGKQARAVASLISFPEVVPVRPRTNPLLLSVV